MFKKLTLYMFLVMIVSVVSHAEDIGTILPNSGEPGYSHDFDALDVAGTYRLGYSLTSITYNFSHGTTFVGALWDCDTQTQAAATCDKVTDLTSDEQTGTKVLKRRHLLVVVTTAEGAGTMSTLVVRGTNSQARRTAPVFVAGVGDIANTRDPRDSNENGTYDDAIACGVTCYFESNTGNIWYFDSVNSLWTCQTCFRTRIAPISDFGVVGIDNGTDCLTLNQTSLVAAGSCTGTIRRYSINHQTAETVASPVARSVIESACFRPNTTISGFEGMKLIINTHSPVVLVIEVDVPSSDVTIETGDVVCSPDVPALIPEPEELTFKMDDGDFCASGPGSCVAAGVNGTFNIWVMDL